MRRALIILLLLAACAREQPASKSAATTATTTQEPVASKAEPGEVMPPYNTTLLDGKPFDIKSQKGSVILLNVWATWCGPCRFEIPELQALQQKYEGRGFKVVGVSVDDTGVAGVQQFVKDNKIT
jgi:thiol-disulfide isomerase/thioredoxin